MQYLPSPDYLLSAAFSIAAGIYVAGLVRNLAMFVISNIFLVLAVQFLPRKPEEK